MKKFSFAFFNTLFSTSNTDVEGVVKEVFENTSENFKEIRCDLIVTFLDNLCFKTPMETFETVLKHIPWKTYYGYIFQTYFITKIPLKSRSVKFYDKIIDYIDWETNACYFPSMFFNIKNLSLTPDNVKLMDKILVNFKWDNWILMYKVYIKRIEKDPDDLIAKFIIEKCNFILNK